jgi:hypothetical protein
VLTKAVAAVLGVCIGCIAGPVIGLRLLSLVDGGSIDEGVFYLLALLFASVGAGIGLGVAMRIASRL